MRYSQIHNELIDSGLFAAMGPHAACVFVVLLHHTSESQQWRCFPSRTRIAREAGIGVRTVDRQIARLIELGLVTKTKRPRKNGFDQNEYVIHSVKDALAKLPGGVRDALPKTGGVSVTRCHSGSRVVSQRQPGGVTGAHEQDQENKTKEQDPKQASNGAAPTIQMVVEEFNLVSGKNCRITESRKKAFRTRIRDPWWCSNWQAAIDALGKSPFCLGENKNGWTADLTWFLKPDSVSNLLEGKYAGKPQRPLGSISGPQKPRVPTYDDLKDDPDYGGAKLGSREQFEQRW